jgi:hypothetical protein
VRSPKKRCTVGGPLDPVSTVPLYRCPSGPPGPALARARLGPAGIVPGLARHYDTSGRVGAAHRLQRRPRHGPTGQIRVGSARTARPYPRTWAARSPPHSSMPPPWRPLRHRPARPLLQLPAMSFRLSRHQARGCGGHHMALSRRSPKRRDGGRRWPDAGRGDKGARPWLWSRGEEEAEIGRLRRWWRKGGAPAAAPSSGGEGGESRRPRRLRSLSSP